MRYADLAAAVAAHGMAARGGFVLDDGDRLELDGLTAPGGAAARCIVVIGNVGGEMWPHFEAGRADQPDPLDAWTKRVLLPIAERFGVGFVHPSDRPYRPFQRWAMRAGAVTASPISMLIDPEFGLWHAYRGAFVAGVVPDDLPAVPPAASPCLSCEGQPCLSSCPVDAFTPGGYLADACRAHVASASAPDCLHEGCLARRSCPVGGEFRYGPAQMQFHMRAFVGIP